MGIETALIIAAVAGTATAVTTSISSSRRARSSAATQRQATEARQAEINKQKEIDAKAAEDAARIASGRPSAARLSLISTSATGAPGSASVGRSKLFGN